MKLGENGEAFFVKETESNEVSKCTLFQTINPVVLFLADEGHCSLRNEM